MSRRVEKCCSNRRLLFGSENSLYEILLMCHFALSMHPYQRDLCQVSFVGKKLDIVPRADRLTLTRTIYLQVHRNARIVAKHCSACKERSHNYFT